MSELWSPTSLGQRLLSKPFPVAMRCLPSAGQRGPEAARPRSPVIRRAPSATKQVQGVCCLGALLSWLPVTSAPLFSFGTPGLWLWGQGWAGLGRGCCTLGSGLSAGCAEEWEPPGAMGEGAGAHWCVIQSPSQQSQAGHSSRLAPVTGVLGHLSDSLQCTPLSPPVASGSAANAGMQKASRTSSSWESCLLPTPTDVPREQHTPPALGPRPGPPHTWSFPSQCRPFHWCLWPGFRPLLNARVPGGYVSRTLPPPGHTARRVLPAMLAQLQL